MPWLGSVMHIMPMSFPKIRVKRNRYRAEGVRGSHDVTTHAVTARITVRIAHRLDEYYSARHHKFPIFQSPLPFHEKALRT